MNEYLIANKQIKFRKFEQMVKGLVERYLNFQQKKLVIKTNINNTNKQT